MKEHGIGVTVVNQRLESPKRTRVVIISYYPFMSVIIFFNIQGVIFAFLCIFLPIIEILGENV